MPIDYTTFVSKEEEDQIPELMSAVEEKANDTVLGATPYVLIVEKLLTLVLNSNIVLDLAKLQWAYYLSLVNAGFTKEQAFELLTKLPSSGLTGMMKKK